jgi:hypothetical protein
MHRIKNLDAFEVPALLLVILGCIEQPERQTIPKVVGQPSHVYQAVVPDFSSLQREIGHDDFRIATTEETL